jgi:hypothetical protein
MAPTPSAATAFAVDSFEEPRWMLWRTPTSTWAWRLVRLPDGGTRLVTRLRVSYGGSPVARALAAVLVEVGDFPMMRRMLRGVRDRAEATGKGCCRGRPGTSVVPGCAGAPSRTSSRKGSRGDSREGQGERPGGCTDRVPG